MSDKCILTGSHSFEKCHVIDNSEFNEIYEIIYGEKNSSNDTTGQNIVYLREDFHRGPMDNLKLPENLRKRRIGFDFINKVCYILDFDTGNWESFPWLVDGIDVKEEYLAWSNRHGGKGMGGADKRMWKKMKNIDSKLIDYQYWANKY